MLALTSVLIFATQEDQCFVLNDFHHDTSQENLWVHDCGVG
jgi:hypothetical protein